MKKYAIVLLFMAAIFNGFSINKGDSLAILYEKVWAYENPEVLSTRLGPYRYSHRKMIFLEESDQFPGFVKVITPDKKTAFIKRNLLAEDSNVNRKDIKQRIEDKVQFKSQYERIDWSNGVDYEWWQVWSVLGAFFIGLFFLWKYFYKVDNWCYKRSYSGKRVKTKPRYIGYAAILGMVVGGFYQVFSPTETEWFLFEGMRFWADYPSYIDWILWVTIWLFAINLVVGVAAPFFRFKVKPAILYSSLNLVLMGLYFFAGFISGGIVVILVIIYLFFSSSGSGVGHSGEMAYNSSGQAIGRIQ